MDLSDVDVDYSGERDKKQDAEEERHRSEEFAQESVAGSELTRDREVHQADQQTEHAHEDDEA